MNILVDTNIIIPLEPGSIKDFEVNTDAALEFHNLAQKSGSILCVHPLIHHDLSQDKNKERANLRKKLIRKYNLISSPPDTSILSVQFVGNPEKGTNNYVDNSFLAAVKGDAVDFLVTEDKGLHKKARKSGLQTRVLYLNDAISLLKDFFDETPPPPPLVEKSFVYELEENDNIFNSLKKDYYPEFDSWFKKCKREHREAYVIPDKEQSCLAGVCIIKRESCLPTGEQGKTLKLCTFKISDNHHGNRYGELIFKSIFDYADQNKYEYIYFTSFPKQDELLVFARSFGFFLHKQKHSEELIVCKKISSSERDALRYKPLDFHIIYGPRVTSFNGNDTFVVPIKPIYHNVLFPELRQQKLLFATDSQPCGNSIKKAYLCHSHTNLIKSGDNLLIYRSQDRSCVTAIAIIEDSIRSSNPNEIARYVGSRTVYRYADIIELCDKPTLAIKFRYVKALETPIGLEELKTNGVLKGAPQSVTMLDQKGIEWIKKKLKM